MLIYIIGFKNETAFPQAVKIQIFPERLVHCEHGVGILNLQKLKAKTAKESENLFHKTKDTSKTRKHHFEHRV